MNEITAAPSPRPPSRLITRRRVLQVLGGSALAIGGAAFNAWCIEPDLLSVTRRTVPCKNLPPGLAGLKVCLLTDFHFRPGDDDELLQKVVASVRAEKPDIIALGGDYISRDPRVIAPMLEDLGKLTATHGIFAVMGNHDGWCGNPSVIRRQFEKAGISFLINQNTVLSPRGEKLAIAGTDFVWRGKPDPVKTLKGLSPNTPVIALVHEPDYFDTMRRHRDVTLQLSGHTHGGQCRVPILGIVPRTVRHGKKYIHGLFLPDNSALFVSRGVGTGGPRVRFACLPELAVLNLMPAET